MTPLPQTDGTVVEVVVLVVVVAQPVAVQASQQLARTPMHRAPPLGAVHRAVARLIAHLVTPLLFVRQQVTKPGRPQVEWDAHRLTDRTQSAFARTAFACCAAHLR